MNELWRPESHREEEPTYDTELIVGILRREGFDVTVEDFNEYDYGEALGYVVGLLADLDMTRFVAILQGMGFETEAWVE